MNAVDTNILIYIHDPRDLRKQDIASDLVVNLADGVLLWQVACEYLAASRKLVPFGYDFGRASDDIRKLITQWSMVLPSRPVMDRAFLLLDRYSLAFWDALLIAACIEAGVHAFYSEDLGGRNEIDGLRIINPFPWAK
ncbi:MAG: PIN domain-containing protein [Planctomycetes bacterium]|nr:PIN domain-containing protein [Planctomycetota bacterium]